MRQTQTCDRQAVRPRAAGLQTPTLSGETRRSSETGGQVTFLSTTYHHNHPRLRCLEKVLTGIQEVNVFSGRSLQERQLLPAPIF